VRLSATRAAGTLAVLVLLLAGCSAEATKHQAAEHEAGPAGGPSASPSATDGPPEPVSAGAQRVESSGVAFEMPEDWRALDVGDLLDGATDSPMVAELADRLGVEPDELVDAVGDIDVFLFSSAGGHHGFVDNVNVNAGPGALPTESQVELQLLRLGAKDDHVDRVTTAAGEALTSTYEIEIGGHVVRGGQIFVHVPDGLVVVTVSTTDAALTGRLVAEVLDTIEATDAETGNG
jgi:hypothetical protein